MTHEELRKQIKKSKELAHRMIFDEYCNYVYAILFNRLRSAASREDIEECFCDVFADIYISYDSERELEGDVKGFVGTVARRRAADMFRRLTSGKGERAAGSIEEIGQVAASDDVEADAETKLMSRLVLDRIAELGEPDSTIIIQRYYYCRSVAEVAEMVSMSPDTVYVRCGRAVKRLRKILEQEGITL